MWTALLRAAAAMFVFCHVIDAGLPRDSRSAKKDDKHGGVPMGVVNDGCDNGQDGIEVDWDPESKDEFTCHQHKSFPTREGLHYYHCDQEAEPPIHKCLHTKINYTDDLPTSGMHRPLWPVYGEYSYVPPQRWLHSLEHGGIVFLYHPCADRSQIKLFTSLAKGCLRRHVVAGYKKLPPEMNFAVLSWKCKLLLSGVDVSLITQFVQARALKGPEQVAADGQYNAGLLHKSDIVSDFKDSKLCPRMSVLSSSMDRITESSRRRQHRLRQAMARLADKLLQGISE